MLTIERIAEFWAAAHEQWANACGGPMEHQIFARMVEQEAARQEREECAKECDEHKAALGQPPIGFLAEHKAAQQCAAAIRSRSDHG